MSISSVDQWTGSFRDVLIGAVCRVLSLAIHRQSPPPNLSSVARLLVLKPCCLGDLLLATPAIAALRRSFPRAHLTVATGAWARPAVDNNPDLDAVLEIPPVVKGPGALWGLAKPLRRGRFDAVVVLDRSPLVSLAAFLAGISVRAGLDSGGRGFSLTHPVSTSPQRHEASLYVDAIRCLAPHAGVPGLRFFPAAEDVAWAQERLAGSSRWVAVHPGGGINPGGTLTGKRWPAERFDSIIQRLLDAGLSVLLAGGHEDAEATAGIAARHGQVLDLAGQTTFGQLGALLAECCLFIGNDTGALHLAVASRTPVVAIFGPSLPQVYGPWSAKARVIYHGDQCRGCRFRGGLVANCRNSFACTRAVTEGEVWTAAQQLLG